MRDDSHDFTSTCQQSYISIHFCSKRSAAYFCIQKTSVASYSQLPIASNKLTLIDVLIDVNCLLKELPSRPSPYRLIAFLSIFVASAAKRIFVFK